MQKKVLVAMSGGVDSSATAAILCQKGYDCIGVTMKLYNLPDDAVRSNTCWTLSDAEDAKSVAYRLGMRYYVMNFTADFSKEVIDRFVSAYERGETPNPCIDCNRYMKFEQLYQRAALLGCDAIATGHYARIAYDEERGRWLLKKSKNEAKDQSYVLYSMTQEQLAHTIFPLGDYTDKAEVRKLAAESGLLNAEKQDSQDICFVPDGDYAAFIEQYTGKQYPHGDFVDRNGKKLGEHKGMIGYTIGQRKGLGISAPHPLYVCKKCVEDNTIVLSEREGLYTTKLIARDFNWIAYDGAPKTPISVTARTRYHAKEAAATVTPLEDGTVQVVFAEPQRAVTAGQAVVLYDGEIVVGGGTITSAE